MNDEKPANILLEIGPQDFAQWQHNPITKGFLQFMDDTIAEWRSVAADALEAGLLNDSNVYEDSNIGVLRGKLVAMRMLRGITLEGIQGFYGQEPAVEAEPESDDE